MFFACYLLSIPTTFLLIFLLLFFSAVLILELLPYPFFSFCIYSSSHVQIFILFSGFNVTTFSCSFDSISDQLAFFSEMHLKKTVLLTSIVRWGCGEMLHSLCYMWALLSYLRFGWMTQQGSLLYLSRMNSVKTFNQTTDLWMGWFSWASHQTFNSVHS